MTLPVLSHTPDSFPGSTADAAVLVVPDLSESAEAIAAFTGLAEPLEAIGFTGSASSFARVHAPDVTALPFAVVGAGKTPDAAAVRNAVGTAIRSLTGFETVSLALAPGLEEFADAAAEGAVL